MPRDPMADSYIRRDFVSTFPMACDSRSGGGGATRKKCEV